MTDYDLFLCKHAKAGVDEWGDTIPICKLSELPCSVVLLYGDDGCEYEKEDRE